jgi:rod shape-determining protein MreD
MSPWILLLLLGALLQSSLFSGLSLAGATPNLVLALVLCWALTRGGREGLIWGLIGGIALDLFSVAPFGTFTVAMLVIAFLTSLAEYLPFEMTRLLPVGITLLASPFFHLVAMIMMETLGWNVAWNRMWTLILPAAILDAIVVFLLFPLVARFATLAGERSIEWG